MARLRLPGLRVHARAMKTTRMLLPAAWRARRFGAAALLPAIGCLLVGGGAAMAQPTLRNLTGHVTDPHHEPLRGAVVQVHDDETNGVISYITDRSGTYSFKRLSGEKDYQVWAIFRGQQSRKRELSHFDTKTEKVIDLTIEPE